MDAVREWEGRQFEKGRLDRARLLEARQISDDPVTYRVTGSKTDFYDVTRLVNPRTKATYWYCTCEDVEMQKLYFCKHEVRARLKFGDHDAIDAYLARSRERREEHIIDLSEADGS